MQRSAFFSGITVPCTFFKRDPLQIIGASFHRPSGLSVTHCSDVKVGYQKETRERHRWSNYSKTEAHRIAPAVRQKRRWPLRLNDWCYIAGSSSIIRRCISISLSSFNACLIYPPVHCAFWWQHAVCTWLWLSLVLSSAVLGPRVGLTVDNLSPF